MFLSLDLANLLLYCAQQLGVALGLGAQTILLVAYLQSMRDGVIDSEEAQFARAVRIVLQVALYIVIISGIAITVLQFTTDAAIVMQPAYLFKWALIIFILLLNVFGGAIPQNLLEGLRGGTWYALFVVHILAPVTSWTNLFTLYALWMVGFNLVWMALLPLTHQRKKKAAAILESKPMVKPEPPKVAPAPISPPPPATPPPPAPKPPPKIEAPLPVVQPLEIDKPTMFVPPKAPATPPAAVVPAKPAPVPEPNKVPGAPLDKIPTVPKQPEDPWLPSIKIMPQTPQDIPNPSQK